MKAKVPELPPATYDVNKMVVDFPLWLIEKANVRSEFRPWNEGYEEAETRYRETHRWAGNVNDRCRWLIWINRQLHNQPDLESELMPLASSLYHSIREAWDAFETPDFHIRINPPEKLRATISRIELREALRRAKKFGRTTRATKAFLYGDGQAIVIEAGDFRVALAGDVEWSGCVAMKAQLLLGFWNSLPSGETCCISYESGWVSVGSLRLTEGVWEPKNDSAWMKGMKNT